MADMVFMLLFLHWRPRYLVCTLSSLRTYSCIMACLTFSALFRMGADLNTTSIWEGKDHVEGSKMVSLINVVVICMLWDLTIVLECFHLVSLLRILSRLMQEKRFLQQN